MSDGYIAIASDGMPYADLKQKDADLRALLSDLRSCREERDEVIKHLEAVLPKG